MRWMMWFFGVIVTILFFSLVIGAYNSTNTCCSIHSQVVFEECKQCHDKGRVWVEMTCSSGTCSNPPELVALDKEKSWVVFPDEDCASMQFCYPCRRF